MRRARSCATRGAAAAEAGAREAWPRASRNPGATTREPRGPSKAGAAVRPRPAPLPVKPNPGAGDAVRSRAVPAPSGPTRPPGRRGRSRYPTRSLDYRGAGDLGDAAPLRYVFSWLVGLGWIYNRRVRQRAAHRPPQVCLEPQRERRIEGRALRVQRPESAFFQGDCRASGRRRSRGGGPVAAAALPGTTPLFRAGNTRFAHRMRCAKHVSGGCFAPAAPRR
jgi:hypothetical protein